MVRGRTPNAFFLEFFERGEKPKNNRVEQTCRKCGQLTNGRVASLLAHLRKCPSITAEQATRVAAFKEQSAVQKNERRAERDAKLLENPPEVEFIGSRRARREREPQHHARHAKFMDNPDTVDDHSNSDKSGKARCAKQTMTCGSPDDPDSLFEEPPDDRDSPFEDLPDDDDSLFEELPDDDDSLFEESQDERLELDEDRATPSTEATYATTLSASSRSSTSAVPAPFMGPKSKKPWGPDQGQKRTEMRKIHACIRCRMLKKTCSKDTPCGPCSTLHRTSLWKSDCTRIRLSEVLDLFSLRTFEQMWRESSRGLDARYHLSDQGGKLLLRHAQREDIGLTLSALYGEPQFPATSHGMQPEPLIMLDRGQGDVASGLDRYFDDLVRNFEANEPSHILRLTLEQASTMTPEIKGTLIPQAMRLWTITQALTAPSVPFDLFYLGPTSRLGYMPRTVTKLPFVDKSPQADGNASPTTVLTAFLLSHFEGMAAGLFGAVLEDLERALMLKIEWRRLEVFPAAILLLASIERLEWFVQCTGGSQEPPDAKTQFFQKAGEFATFLCEILRQRSVVPRCRPDRERGGILMPIDGGEVVAHHWFEEAKLTVDDLKARRRAACDPKDPTSLELKYTALLLMPELRTA